jgi:hypothetical protein
MDSVATHPLKRMVAGPVPALVLSLLLLTALLLLSFAAQNEARLADIFAPLLIINLAGIVLLFILSLASLVTARLPAVVRRLLHLHSVPQPWHRQLVRRAHRAGNGRCRIAWAGITQVA